MLWEVGTSEKVEKEKDKEKGKVSNLPHGMMDRSFGEKEKINSEAIQVAEKDLEKGKSVKVLNPPRGMVMSIGEKENLRDFLKEKRNLQQALEKQLLMFIYALPGPARPLSCCGRFSASRCVSCGCGCARGGVEERVASPSRA